MVNWNPNFPDVLGLEFLVTKGQKRRVWAGDRAVMHRLISTVTEPITDLKLSAEVNPLLSASVPTLIDVIEEGNEYVALPKIKRLKPSVDRVSAGWSRSDGGTTSLYTYIDDPATTWPAGENNTAQSQWLRSFTNETPYMCGLDATIFKTGGAAENGRIHWVGVQCILGSNAAYRKMRIRLVIDGVAYDPAGGHVRDVHFYGAIYSLWWGEINPATGLPWTPADIAKFDTETDWGIRLQSVQATTSHYPQIYAVALNVHYSEAENREAVGVWRRPEDLPERLTDVTTDALITMPSGAAGWSKETGKNYLFYWRQSVSPSQYGAIVADDVRWNGAYQALPSNAQPPGVVYPLYHSGEDPPSNILASQDIAHDQFGRPQEEFTAFSGGVYGLVLTATPVSGTPAPSVDSQPYRLDIGDLGFLHSGQSYGQKVTLASTQSYLGVRLPIIPPQAGPAGSTLTVSVHEVSGGAQVGGSLTLTESEIRELPAGVDNIRYVTGLLSSGATLNAGTAYEIRVSTTAPSKKPWIVFVPSSVLGPEVSFGGTTNGAYVGAAHQSDRDLVINLTRQPDPVTGVSAVATNVPVTMPDGTARDVDHALVSWTAPAVPLGITSFARYEVERQMAGETTWTRIIDIPNDGLTHYEDHMVKRAVPTTYRVRQIATDGRFSDWAYSSSLTIEAGDYSVILTSNHRPDLEVLLDVDLETTYEFLSTANDETVPIHGSDFQVVFIQSEDRGMRWQFNAEVNFDAEPEVGKTGDRVFDRLNALIRAQDVPYVAMLDFQGTRVLGHVTPSSGKQKHPGNVYSTQLDIVPTHGSEEALGGPMIAFMGASSSASSTASIPAGIRSGDLLVAFAYRENVTPPSLPASWTNIQAFGASGNSFRAAYRFWDGSFTGPAWTNAESVLILAYRGVDATRPIGANQAETSTGGLTAPSAGTFEVGDRTSWGVSMYGAASLLGLAPGFGVERVDLANAPSTQQVGACDSDGGVGEWLGGSVDGGLNAGAYAVISLELRAEQ